MAHSLGWWCVVRWCLQIARMCWEPWQWLSQKEREGQEQQHPPALPSGTPRLGCPTLHPMNSGQGGSSYTTLPVLPTATQTQQVFTVEHLPLQPLPAL